MKKNIIRLSLIGLVAVICGIFSSCNGDAVESFSVAVKEIGPEYVCVQVSSPSAVEFAYLLDTEDKGIENPVMIFKKGESLTVKPNDIVRISKGLEEKTQYYLYAVAKLNEEEYSEIFTLPFQTGEYNLSELITVVDQAYDGYKVRITVPEETKARGNAIRYGQCDIMMYNYQDKKNNDYKNLLHNGDATANVVTDDKSLTYSEELNWFYTDEDSNGDGELDLDYRYNPISPGEPVVFIAGEFEWMNGDQDATKYFGYPAGWDPGYYKPLLSDKYFTEGPGAKPGHDGEDGDLEQSSVGVITDYEITSPMDPYWTGAFQRKHFRVREPQPLDGKVDVQLVAASPIDLVMDFIPDDNVVQYAIGVFNDSMYDQVMELCNGREEYMQWAITSFFGAYTLGTSVAQGKARMTLTDFYYQDAIDEETEFHVLVTAMGDKMATSQSFQRYTFSTTKKTMEAPVIEVVAVESKTTPYSAAYNIKCTSASEGNPVTQCYYAANYLRDWLLAVNGGSTYFNLVAGNKQYSYFNEDEIEKINSEAGLDVSFPSIDGETTRLVVLGYNEEYTPNDLSSFKDIEECPAVADCTTPWLPQKDYVEESHYIDLTGDWTATAYLYPASGQSSAFIHQSKITIAADLYDYPSELPESVYDLYQKASKYDRNKVDVLWDEFKSMAKTVTNHRLKYQNRLVAMGWFDKDSYNRLDTKSPYALFTDSKYSSVDVSSIYNDYGPKWYIEAVEDKSGNVSLVVPFDSDFLPPAANWSIPFYMAGMELTTFYAITRGDGWTPSFPVEVSADRNTITIKPLIYTDSNGRHEFYPQMIGMDNASMKTVLENPVVSEIVLTRGWKGGSGDTPSVSQSSVSVPVNVEMPAANFKKMTPLHDNTPTKEIKGKMVTVEQFEARADELVEKKFGKYYR
jgi:hypothetical protein